MSYPALPDRRIPYDNDGTLVYIGTEADGATNAQSNATLAEWQDNDYAGAGTGIQFFIQLACFVFFPEQREVTGIYSRRLSASSPVISTAPLVSVKGSNDTTNGLDGTWEAATLPSGVPGHVDSFSWRSDIKPVSFTGPKKNLRLVYATVGTGTTGLSILHLYGEAGAGQMTHDLVFIDQDAGSPAEYTAPEDFGDQPLGTTVVRAFRVKNTSATRTATNVNIQCNDVDFTIGEANTGPWVVTINLASLAPGAESPTYYVRCTTPAPGAPLLPRFARIVVTCDAGFFG